MNPKDQAPRMKKYNGKMYDLWDTYRTKTDAEIGLRYAKKQFSHARIAHLPDMLVHKYAVYALVSSIRNPAYPEYHFGGVVRTKESQVKKGRLHAKTDKKAAPLRIIGVYDNGGRTADRYTVVFDERHRTDEGISHLCLALSKDCNMPNGVCMTAYTEPGSYLGKKIKFSDLPETVQNCVRRWRE